MRYKVVIEFVQDVDPDDMRSGRKAFDDMSEKKKEQTRREIARKLESSFFNGNIEGSLYYARGQGTLKVTVQYLDDDWSSDWDEDAAGESFGY